MYIRMFGAVHVWKLCVCVTVAPFIIYHPLPVVQTFQIYIFCQNMAWRDASSASTWWVHDVDFRVRLPSVDASIWLCKVIAVRSCFNFAHPDDSIDDSIDDI